MKGLILLYWGTVFLMYLSQTYYPVEAQLDGRQTGKRHFMLRRADVFMIATILWLTSFSFLRVAYNDSPLSSKRQKNICMTRHLATGAVFLTLLVGLLFKKKSKHSSFVPIISIRVNAYIKAF